MPIKIILIYIGAIILCSCSHRTLSVQKIITKTKIPAIGEQIRQFRLIKGISQEELAKAVKISQNSLSLIEDGLATPIFNKITAIEDFLEVEIIRDSGIHK